MTWHFFSRNTSTIPFDSTYQPKSKFNSAVIDSIIRQPIGAVYGPYVDQNGYVLKNAGNEIGFR